MDKPEDLHPWFYPVTINGETIEPGTYPPGTNKDRPTPELIRRYQCRRQMLFDPLKNLDLKDARILDVACNCAYWSLQYIKHLGASEVVGIEGRELFVRQAKLLYESAGAKGTFIHDSVNKVDFSKLGKFDFVLCAGILYHVKEHEELIKKIANVGAQTILIDTRVDQTDSIQQEPKDRVFNGIPGEQTKRVPMRKSMLKLIESLGYNPTVLPVPFEAQPGVDGVDNYNTGLRITVLSTKS
jgi:SAM-dependent methyltransferase